MRRILKKLFYKNVSVVEYSGITIRDTIQEKVYLKINNQLIDVSAYHWVLCLQPLIFGVWISKQDGNRDISINKPFSLLFRESNPSKKLADVSLSLFNIIEEQNGKLLLLKAEKSKIWHTTVFETILLYLFFYRKPGFNFKKFKLYVSAFSYPRQVRMVSFQNKDYYNIFPMDLAGPVAGANYYVFGLRHTSKALKEIINEKKLVVSEVPSDYKKIIYELGSHHSSTPPPLNQLPFQAILSKHFCFPVPKWAEKYNEIRIVHTMNLGSHMMLWGQSENEEIINPQKSNLYHIHFLLSLIKKRASPDYIEV